MLTSNLDPPQVRRQTFNHILLYGRTYSLDIKAKRCSKLVDVDLLLHAGNLCFGLAPKKCQVLDLPDADTEIATAEGPKSRSRSICACLSS